MAPVVDFFTLADAMEVAIVIVQGTSVRYVNPAAVRMTGYTREELLAMRFWDFMHPDDRDIVRERGLARQAGGDVPRHGEYRLRRKDGATVWIDFSGALIEHEGAPAVIGTAVDVTPSKEAELALRRSEARLRRLVDANILGVIVGDFAGRITEANEAFLSMLGYTVADLPLRWDVLTPREWRWTDERAIRSLHETGIAPPYEKEYVHRHGHRVPVLIGIALLDPSTADTICFVLNLTERKRAEEAVESSLADLKASEEKLRRVAAREVAGREAERKRLGFDLHDNVCQELIGTGMVIASVARRLGGDRADLAAELGRASRFLDEVVEHLRGLARELRPLQLRDAGLEQSLRVLAERMTSPATSIVATVAGAVPRLAEDVEVAVYRVAQEALTNALRHGGPRSVEVTLAAVDGRVRLEVRDDGRGFDVRARPSDALGLTSMEERAAALGGSFRVESAPGAGTTVCFECPAVAAGDR